MAIAKPRTTDAATRLIERFAALDVQVAAIEAARNTAIGAANVEADAKAAPLLEELAGLREVLEGWFAKSGHTLLPKGRKSMELGGCMVGTKSGRDTLAVAGNEDAIAVKLQRRRWAAGLFRVKVSIEKRAVLAATDGPKRSALRALGLSRKVGTEDFVLERVAQAGVVTEAAA